MTDHDRSDRSDLEVLDSDDTARGGRWAALSPRTRRLALAGAGAALLALAGGYVLVNQPEPVPPEPAEPDPYPIHSTHFSFIGMDAGPGTGEKGFEADISAFSETGATLQQITQGYENLELSVDPPLPLKLKQGHPTRFTLRFEVTRCAGLPIGARLPSLRVTLRNTRAIQDYSSILGETYAAELTRALRTICEPPSPAAQGSYDISSDFTPGEVSGLRVPPGGGRPSEPSRRQRS